MIISVRTSTVEHTRQSELDLAQELAEEYVMDEQYRTNLKALADYLVTLPDDYEKFNMNVFYREGTGMGNVSCPVRFLRERPKEALYSCGTAACAVGHSLAVPSLSAQIKKLDLYMAWDDVSNELFGIDPCSITWEYLFSGQWDEHDNTPAGAAARIYNVLNGFEPTEGDLPWIDW